MAFKRTQVGLLTSRLLEKRRFIQVLAGPRQSGKTTVARQVAEALTIPVQFVSADDPEAHGRIWLEQQWEIGRVKARGARREGVFSSSTRSRRCRPGPRQSRDSGTRTLLLAFP